MATEVQSLVTAHVDGVGDLGIFDKRTGGDTNVSTAKHRPGGMQPEKAYRTLPTYSDVVVSRVMEPERGDWDLVRRLNRLAGNTRMTVTEQPLDDDANPYGDPIVYRGRLGNVKNGQVDSNGTAVRMFEIDCYVEVKE